MSKKYFGLIAGAAVFVIVLLLPAPGGMSVTAKSAAGRRPADEHLVDHRGDPDLRHRVSAPGTLSRAAYLPSGATASNYGHNYVLMMLGGFFLARAIEAQNLHKRIALVVINLFGTSRKRSL